MRAARINGRVGLLCSACVGIHPNELQFLGGAGSPLNLIPSSVVALDGVEGTRI